MLRQATIGASKNDKAVALTVIHDTEDEADNIRLQVNGGQPIEVAARHLREAIADVLPKGEA